MPNKPGKLPDSEPPLPTWEDRPAHGEANARVPADRLPRGHVRRGTKRSGPTLGNGKLLLYLSINATFCALGCGGLGAGVYSALIKPAADWFRQVNGMVQADIGHREKEGR